MPPKAQSHSKKPVESSKIHKMPLFIKKKNTYFLQNEKQVWELFYETNADISISKTTFKPSGKTKILPKTTSDYFLIHNYVFSSAIHRITKNQIAIEEYI